jgi:ketosteroid isomerase-like protein
MRAATDLTLLLLLTLLGCGKPGTDGAPTSAAADARQVVQKRVSDYADAVRSGHADAIPDFWSDTALVLEPGREIHGRASMAGMIGQLISTMNLTRFALVTTEVTVHDGGTVAYVWGKIDEALEPREGKAPPLAATNNLLLRVVKESDGVWRFDRLIETPMPPDPDQAEQAPAK